MPGGPGAVPASVGSMMNTGGDAPARPVPPIFELVGRLQGGEPWGAVLDAGTGARSADWLAGLETTQWTAVTADAGILAETQQVVAARQRNQDRLLLGNWADPAFLAGETHDTVVAEYLLGAVDAYAPYFQEDLFARLRAATGRRLYVVGLDPYVVGRPADATGRLVQEVGCFRDACHLLATQAPFREYPAEWVVARLERAGLRVTFAQRFPNRYDMRWVDQQLGIARMLYAATGDRPLIKALSDRGRALRARAARLCDSLGGLAHGHDYLIAAEV